MNRIAPFTFRTVLAAAVGVFILALDAAAQQEIGYIEDFALAADREEALKQLIPGTENYYYYHALHFQNTRQAEKLADILAQWEKRFPSSTQREMIRRREALLNYSADPKGSLEFIRRGLGLKFDHQQEGKARAQDFPSALDQAEVAWSKFLEEALRGTKSLERLAPETFFELLASGHELTEPQRRDLLQRATVPDLPGLVGIIVADLNAKESRGFGEFPIHGLLTIAQLDELRGKKKDLLRSEGYVHTYLSKLRPGPDSNPAAEPAVREAYLERAWNFVKDLEPAFHSIQAHVLYQRLVFDHARGVHDTERFMEYIKLPRNVHYIRAEWRTEAADLWRSPADVRQNFEGVTGLAPIVTDEPLVRAYLLHLLKEAEDYKTFAPYLDESWLKAVFAEAKIVNGIGDPERWASLLSPAAFQALKERVDIEFDPTSPEEFGITDTVKLRVHIKNVETLIVKVFEVNTLSYYLEKGTEVSTDLDLDGLVTNFEKTVKYDDAPQLRVARDFEFPEIETRRGVWVVEFIGGSKSSRALIRRGKLEILSETASGGEVLTVLNEDHKPERDAAIWFGGRRIECDEKGRALVPFSNEPGQRTAVIEGANRFASLVQFQHPGESYQLQAGMRVDREALRPGASAQIVVRPTLMVAGRPISLSRLDEVRLVLTSTDLDGVSTTDTVDNFEVSSDREATHEFRVPDRLAKLSVQLRAKVKQASQGGTEIELSDGAEFEVNGQLRSDRVDDLYLGRIDGSYVLEFLGRIGEARNGQNVNVTARRSGFENPRRVTLRTDEAGKIDLGALEGIAHITAEAPGGHQRAWALLNARRTHPGLIHAELGEAVRIPYFGTLDRSEVALLELTTAGYTSDAFDKLALENGFLVAKGLAAGDYNLLLKESGQGITVRVASGTKSHGHVFNRARMLELRERRPAHLANLAVAGESLLVEVADADEQTRVHLIATRFLPDFDLFAALGEAPRRGLSSGRPGRLPNLFISGRKIGDEYRYILERRYAQKFPGNMLERPEILLNPWAVRDTEAEEEVLRSGDDFARQRPGDPAGAERGAVAAPGQALSEGGSARSVDFLANGPVELLNLQPEEDGKITIDLAAFGDRQHVHVLVVDSEGASYQDLSLPERDTALRDLRLLNALDPSRHFTEQDAVTLLKAGETLKIPDLFTARFEVFEDLGAAYGYLLAMREDPVLREFGFLIDWPNLKDDEKRDRYSKYACHEFSFFLAMKDPEFFKAVVVPHLKNKKDETFLDEYLLEAQLAPYLAPFEYNRLNVLERILLGHRKDRLESVRMDLRDRLALQKPDLTRENLFFEGALSTGGLSWSVRNRQLGEVRAVFGSYDVSPDDGANAIAATLRSATAAPQPGNISGGVRRALTRNAAALAELEPEDADVTESLEKLVAQRKELDEKGKRVREEAQGRFNKARISSGQRIDVYADDFGLPAEEGFYRAIESTKEWAENNYYRLPIASHNYDLIPESKFWLDFAKHEGAGFGSRHLGEASRSVHEMLLALAVLDLPFKAGESKTVIEDGTLEFTAAGDAIAFHREIKEAGLAENRPPLLVSQSYFRHGDRHKMDDGGLIDKFVTEEFVAGAVYGAQVVVTNPTSSRQKLDVLIQIPRGAVPVLGHRATATQRVTLEPYTTQRFERYFYFPVPGQYPIYPAHVSKNGEVVAHAEGFEFKVVEKASVVDETSWAHLSQRGSEGQVLAYLTKQNVHAIDLSQMAWRCRESEDFFKKAVAILDLRGIYHPVVYSYGIHHDHAPTVRQFLLVNEAYLNRCGDYLASELVTVDPIARRAYEHLEYKPLVNNRAHSVGGSRKILNSRIRIQYIQFLTILSQKAELDPIDRLSVTYYLFLQDRAGEAIERLETVDRNSLPTPLQHDYFQAYAAFYGGKPAEARAIAANYTSYPVDRWRERFANVIVQADEIEGKGPEIVSDEDRDQQQGKLAAAEPTLELEVDGAVVALSYEKIANVQVNYYEMDLEFLFSTNPFVSSGSGSFSVVQPNKSERLQLADDKREHKFELPREYQSKNVLVEVIGGGKKRSRAVYSNELQTAVSERYGILTVKHAQDFRPLPATYVKVYALTGSGPQFYKDGYTDLRGKFDYASVSTSDIADAQKFSILVMSDEFGATVLEAPVPQR